MNRACALLGLGCVLVAFAASAQALELAPANDAAMSEVEAASNDAPLLKKKSRLRFKNGPVCLCSDGLSEQDIRKAALEKSAQKKSEKTP